MSSILNCNDEAGGDVSIKFVYLELAIVSYTLTPQSRTSSRETPVPRSQEREHPGNEGHGLNHL